MTTRIAVTAATNVGKVRSANQDRIVVGPWVLSSGHLDVVRTELEEPGAVVAVLDGMGGHADGALAASIAADELAGRTAELVDEAAIAAVLGEINAHLYDRMATVSGLSGMGSTVVGAAYVGGRPIVFNVGDSRAFVERAGYLLQVSTDDVAPGGRGIVQALGGLPSPQAIQPHVTGDDDGSGRLLLCSDGLSGVLSLEQMEACLVDDDESTVVDLVLAAIEAGGPDNISVALVRRVGSGGRDV